MTYSIVARCPETGQLGVAVQSHFFSVGSVVPWLAAGVGAVATQATAEIAHGPDGLDRLRSGRRAAEALADVLAADAHAATRQVGVVDAAGAVAAHTGSACIAHAGHVLGEGFAAQANMMERPGVPEAMAAAFGSAEGPLAGRLLVALDAAEAHGGDIRGQQSAALVVVEGQPSARSGHDQLIDVRVDDHPSPLVELRRLTALSIAYRRMDEAEEAMTGGRLDEAQAIYAASMAGQPDNPEFPFWRAVMLAGLGRHDEARVALAPVVARPDGHRWIELARRLPAAGLLPADAVAGLLGSSVSSTDGV